MTGIIIVMVAYGYKSSGGDDHIIKLVDKSMEDFGVIFAQGAFMADAFPFRGSINNAGIHDANLHLHCSPTYSCLVPRCRLEEGCGKVPRNILCDGRTSLQVGPGTDGTLTLSIS